MRVFFNAIIVQIILSSYVLWRGWNSLPPKKAMRLPLAVFFGIEITIYLIGYFLSRSLPLDVMKTIGWIGTTWMIFIIYLTICFLFYDLIRFINKKKPFIPQSFNPRRYGIRRIYYTASLFFTIGIMIWGHYNFHHPRITELNLTIPKESTKIEEMKVVVASDIHVGTFINRSLLKMYVDKIMEQKPDLILLPGDIIDFDLKPVVEQNMQEEFKRLKAKYGVYGTTGNHEYIKIKGEADHAKVDWLVEKSGIRMLRDTTIMIDSTFYLVGREDHKAPNRKSIDDLAKNTDKSFPIFVMNHEPHNLSEEVDAGADLALYGHTHNGQFFPVNLSLHFMYELPYGYKKKENTHCYVSSGLGLAGPQYRIGTISEIVVLNLKFKKE